MESKAESVRGGTTGKKRRLQSGFSTGSAVAAAARAALRLLLTGRSPEVIAIRLPSGCFLPVPIASSGLEPRGAVASVIKNGGDDPDVTHGAEIMVRLRCLPCQGERSADGGKGFSGSCSSFAAGGIFLVAGEGVGVVTKAGLPVRVGEPAVNPVPREMLKQNLSEELLPGFDPAAFFAKEGKKEELGSFSLLKPHVFLPFNGSAGSLSHVIFEVEIEVPKGIELSKHTLNPRLGISGGISILGTTGIVRPFSNKAYEETIDAALAVARANGCSRVVLSTGGKSEHYARKLLPGLDSEAFVQIADFFAFGVGRVRDMGFRELVHSLFFGKVVKMAQGHAYTHAHKVPLDLNPLAEIAKDQGFDEPFCRELSSANTARQALELLRARRASGVIECVAAQALDQSMRIAGSGLSVRLLLFDYDGTLLADLKS